MKIRKIGVVSVNRSDYSLYLPVLQALQQDPELIPELMVTGAHLAENGGTAGQIIDDGIPVSHKVYAPLQSDTPDSIVRAMSAMTAGFSDVFLQSKPDFLLVLGDRYEMHAAVQAAVPFRIPIAHIHGGEITEGAMDEQFRHSITKMSHYHFVATETGRKRVVQMGEQPERVFVTGSPAIDNLNQLELLARDALADALRITMERAPVLVTYHPETLSAYASTATEILQALEPVQGPIVFTQSCPDAHADGIMREIEGFVDRRRDAYIVANLGPKHYYSMLACARMMVGNSSSGIIEAPSFSLPVINIGDRQKGRERAANVIDVPNRKEAIVDAMARSQSDTFKATLSGLENPYGSGAASEKIIEKLKSIPLDVNCLRKPFYEVSIAECEVAHV